MLDLRIDNQSELVVFMYDHDVILIGRTPNNLIILNGYIIFLLCSARINEPFSYCFRDEAGIVVVLMLLL